MGSMPSLPKDASWLFPPFDGRNDLANVDMTIAQDAPFLGSEAVDALVIPLNPIASFLGLPETRLSRLLLLLVALATSYTFGYVGATFWSPDSEDAFKRCREEFEKAQLWIAKNRSCAFEAEWDVDASELAWETFRFFARTSKSTGKACVYVQLGMNSHDREDTSRLEASFQADDDLHRCFKAVYVDEVEMGRLLQPLFRAHGDESVLEIIPGTIPDRWIEVTKSVSEIRALQPDAEIYLSMYETMGQEYHTEGSNNTELLDWSMNSEAAVRIVNISKSSSIKEALGDLRRLEERSYALYAVGRGADGKLGWALRIDGDLLPSPWLDLDGPRAILLVSVKQESAMRTNLERFHGVCEDEEWDRSRDCRCSRRRWDILGSACPDPQIK